MKYFLFLVFFLALNGATIASDKVMLFGHNLTSTTYTLKKNQTTIGNYVIGYGATDSLTLGVSPWIVIDYNMPMLDIKYGNPFNEKYRYSIEGLYFKTYPYGKNYYDMEAWMSRTGISKEINEHFTFHTNLIFAYFVNDKVPFSLRFDPGNDCRYTLSLGTLMEISLDGNWGLLQEFGVLGLNYYNSYFQWGSSVFYRWNSVYAQLGFSQSATIRKVGVNQQGQSVYTTQHVWHPEAQLQFFF